MEPRSVRAGGLHCLIWGDDGAPPALLVHGAGMLARWWEPLVPHLADFRLLVPDLRGHGASAWTTPPRYMIEDFAADLLAMMDEIELRPAVLAGHSMGGRVAVWLAAHEPRRFSRVALLDTRMSGLSQERVDRWRGASRSGTAQRVFANRREAEASFRITPDEPGVAASVRERLARHAVVERSPGEWALCFDRAVLSLDGSRAADFTHLLSRVRCPALVVRGEQSTVAGRAGCDHMAAAIPEARVAEIPGGHHFALAHPREAGQLLHDFFTGH